jgi:hypothetical protein
MQIIKDSATYAFLSKVAHANPSGGAPNGGQESWRLEEPILLVTKEMVPTHAFLPEVHFK